MKRKLYNNLLKWKDSASRKPLMLYGARQVGKTYLLQEFGKKEYENLVYINCYKNETIKQLYNLDKDTNRLLRGLSAFSNQSIYPGKTLIFLDEVQEIPAAVSALKYFAEDAPDYHIVVAGSLLGVMNMQGESFPVGKIDILHLRPMDFPEFLMALGEEALSKLINEHDLNMMDIMSEKYIELLRQYYFVGGMPEAVKLFATHHNIQQVRKVQNTILSDYMNDIAKHTGKDAQRIRMVWNSIPAQLAKENKKFIFGAVKKGARAADFETAIQWLLDAGLVYKIERVKDVKVPLKFYADPNAFKLFILDIGLLGALSEAPADQILIGNNIFKEYKGAFTENYVLQQMKSRDDLYIYYYSKDNSKLEIDFIVQKGSIVLPIEVKAEENTKAKSLHTFITKDYESYHMKGIRLSMKNYIDQDWMENLPLYAVSCI